MKVTKQADGRMFAPTASRNQDAIESVLTMHLPQDGNVLEIASGTGQHIGHFAQKFNHLNWQPSDIDAERRTSIDAWQTYLGLGNLTISKHVNIAQQGWQDELDAVDFIMMVNLLHLISEVDMLNFMRGTVKLLNENGQLFICGPFMRNGVLTSDGDQKFHASLQAQNALIGYKNIEDVTSHLLDFGFKIKTKIKMPANNLAIVAQLVN